MHTTESLIPKKIIYTAIYGDYDRLLPLSFDKNNDTEYWCFTDNANLKAKGWKIIFLNNPIEVLGSTGADISLPSDDLFYQAQNRAVKIYPKLFIKGAMASAYIDSHIQIKQCLSKFIDSALKKADWLSPPHRDNGNTLIEAIRCYDAFKINLEQLLGFFQDIYDGSFNDIDNIPFPENGLIIRNHQAKSVDLMCSIWWSYLIKGPFRDQLHWQKSYIESGVKFSYLQYKFTDTNNFYQIQRHKGYVMDYFRKKIKKLLIHFAYKL
jgi:hypothetical protein